MQNSMKGWLRRMNKCCATCMWNIGSDLADEIQKENHYTEEETNEIVGCILNIDHHGTYICDSYDSEIVYVYL